MVVRGERHHAGLAECSRVELVAHRRRELDAAFETALAFLDVAADTPEVPHRRCEAKLALRVADRLGVRERRTDVVVLELEAVEPGSVHLALPVEPFAFDELEKPVELAVVDLALVP